MSKTSIELLREYRNIIDEGFARNLQTTVETVHTLYDRDFDNFIRSVYGQPYEVVPDEEWNNDSSHRFVVEKKPYTDNVLDMYDLKKLDTFINTGKSSYIAHILFRDLANRDLIEPGVYVINVSW
jgi:hypothetical protein